MHRYKHMETNGVDDVVRKVIMKEKLCFILGTLGAWIAGLFGGWSSAMTTEKVAGDFNVTTTTNLYYKISIIIKSGITLSASLYNSIPTLYPK